MNEAGSAGFVKKSRKMRLFGETDNFGWINKKPYLKAKWWKPTKNVAHLKALSLSKCAVFLEVFFICKKSILHSKLTKVDTFLAQKASKKLDFS